MLGGFYENNGVNTIRNYIEDSRSRFFSHSGIRWSSKARIPTGGSSAEPNASYIKFTHDEYELSTELEFKLFGGVRPHGYARASMFQISGALAEADMLAPSSNEKYGQVVLPAGTTLPGYLCSNVPMNSTEGLAVLMSLLGIRSLNMGIGSSNVDCVVTINTGSIDLEQIYI